MANGENIMLQGKNEWSHFIRSDDIDVKPRALEITASEEERRGLCKRLNLQDIAYLSAKITLHRNTVSKFIEIEGDITAQLTQCCVITAESVEEAINETFHAWFADPSNAVSLAKAKRDRLPEAEKAEQPMIEESDDPEPVVNGKIDLGELVTQHLSLALDPYPRAPNAEWPEVSDAVEDQDKLYDNPFAALKEWKAAEQEKARKKNKKDH